MTPVPLQRLIGVGVGPGDPELVTLRAARILNEADLVVCPDASIGRAEDIVAAVAPAAAILRVEFSMSRDVAEREASRTAAARTIRQAFEDGAGLVAFATIGDPNVYSTFSWIADEMPAEVAVSTVPGITAMQLFAAETGSPLVLGDEVLSLAPATMGLDRVRIAAEAADTLVVYKAGRTVAPLVAALTDDGFDVSIGCDLGTERARILTAEDVANDARLGYFTSVMARRPR